MESLEDEQKLEALEKAGKLKRIPFKDRAEMEKLVAPVMAAYAKEIGVEDINARSAPSSDVGHASSSLSFCGYSRPYAANIPIE